MHLELFTSCFVSYSNKAVFREPKILNTEEFYVPDKVPSQDLSINTCHRGMYCQV